MDAPSEQPSAAALLPSLPDKNTAPLQMGKASIGRFSSRSLSSVASSTDGDSLAKEKAASPQLGPGYDGAEPPAVDPCGDAAAGDSWPAARESVDPVDGWMVDALLAEGGDADVVTGAPLPSGPRDRQDRAADASVSATLDASSGQQVPAEPGAWPAAAGAAAASDRPRVQQAASAAAATASDSAARSHHPAAAQPLNSVHARSDVQPGGVLLTAANLAKLNAGAEDQGIRHVQGQLDDRGRCRIDKI